MHWRDSHAFWELLFSRRGIQQDIMRNDQIIEEFFFHWERIFAYRTKRGGENFISEHGVMGLVFMTSRLGILFPFFLLTCISGWLAWCVVLVAICIE